MILKKSKILIYTFLFLLFINFAIPICSFATNDSIYVWSNNSSSIPTTSSTSEKIENYENTRKFFGYYFR